jgi:diguanylate cyclase (GGDEF)-like protein
MTWKEATILIVDDIAANRDILARRFARRGFKVTEAESGRRALELIDNQTFDLVFLDIEMPEMSGLEVLKRIRERNSPVSLPVIMVTGKSHSNVVAEAFAQGANDYVTKPVDFVVAFARTSAQLALKKAEEVVVRANESLRQMNENLEQRVVARTTELVLANQRLRTEVEERERSEAKSHHIAHHDALTGLANRALFQQQLNGALGDVGRNGGSLAILFLDLDGFKNINDTLGHSIGDSFLKSIAERLRGCLREHDIIARLGGDEFAIVQTAREQPAAAAALANRLIEAINEPCLINGNQLVAGVSIGIAISHSGKDCAEALVRSADLAMYRAKSDGRGVYRFFEPEMDTSAQNRRLMEIQLRQAVQEDQFELYYQPLFDLTQNRILGFEALLRWHHPDRGLVLPTEFISLAEEVGLIIPLGRWILRQACAEAAKWPADISVAVNVSAVQFRFNGLLESVLDALAASSLPARRLELEITESVLLEKTESNLNVLKKLQGLGVRISLDDFGTGYSSLSYLRSFCFDKIKVDQSFVNGLMKGPDSSPIVRAIADIGFSFGIMTCAEGVETQEQLNCLMQEGYTEVQGFLLGRPIPASEIALRLLENARHGNTALIVDIADADQQSELRIVNG